MRYFYCEFDSKIFKRKWYRLDLSDEEILDSEKIKKAIFESDADYVDTKLRIEKALAFEAKLKELKFRKICKQVTLCCDLDKQKLKAEKPSTYCNLAIDINTINAIANSCCDVFTTSRFYLDEMLEKDLVFDFFCNWIKNSLSNDSMVKFILNNSFCTLKRDNKNMTIDLIAVPKKEQKKGIGAKLLSDAINYSKKAGCKYVWATTETENRSAVSLYLKHGFEYRYFTTCFHLKVEDLKKSLSN
ncbi:MAG: GNAT family N-acetyltransferase [Candidatus Thermoplasmatota archaeon]